MAFKALYGDIQTNADGHFSTGDMFRLYGKKRADKLPGAWLRDRGLADADKHETVDAPADLFVSLEVASRYAAFLNKMLAAEFNAEYGKVAREKIEKADKTVRDAVRAVRKVFTDALASCGVHDDAGVRSITNELYRGLLGANASDLYREYGIRKSLREQLPNRELMALVQAESSAALNLMEMGKPATYRQVCDVVHDSAVAVRVLLDHQRGYEVADCA